MGDNKQEFFELIESLNDEEWDIKVSSDLTIKEIVSQFIGWDEEFAVCLVDSWQNNEAPWFVKTKDFDNFNKSCIDKYKKYSSRQLIERWKFVIKVLDSEINDIGIGKIKAKGELFDWIFDDSVYEKYLSKIKAVIGFNRVSDIKNTDFKQSI